MTETRRLTVLTHHVVAHASPAAAPVAAATSRSAEMMVFAPDLPPGPGGSPYFQPVNHAPEESKGITFAEMQGIGLRHATFHSAAFRCDVGYCIYLPPGLSTGKGDGATGRLPVIYNLHGAGGNEFHSFYDVKALHDGIVDGRYPPTMMVLPNGGFTWYKNSWDGRFPVETMLIDELLPHIDDTYPTVAGVHSMRLLRFGAQLIPPNTATQFHGGLMELSTPMHTGAHGRCIEGYSMGGRGSTRLAMKYPHLFCSLHNQAGNVLNLASMGGQHDGDGRGIAPGWDGTLWKEYLGGFLGPDKWRYEADDTFLLLQKNLEEIKGKVRIKISCGTQDDTHLPTNRLYHEALLHHGVDHTYVEYEDMRHDGSAAMIRLNKEQWYDYHFESMRRATANLPTRSILRSDQA